MTIIQYKSYFIGLSIFLVILSLLSIFIFGIKLGIDFTGGTVIEARFVSTNVAGGSPPLNEEEISVLKSNNIETFRTDLNSEFPIYKFISSDVSEKILPILKNVIVDDIGYRSFEVDSVTEVGPTLGQEMTKKAIIAIVVVIVAILAFIAFAFREVSEPVSSWKYGWAAMLTMAHDIVIPAGVYVFLSQYFGAEVDTLFVIALLTIMAVTISDKIVVFDRIRENLKNHASKSKNGFSEVVGLSLKQTAVRSINTSLTTVLALVALFFLGPDSTRFFALTLMVGIIVGTYSSICVASPLLTYFIGKNKGEIK